MAQAWPDRVADTTTDTGSGSTFNLLGEVPSGMTGYRTIASQVANGATIGYLRINASDPSEWETATGSVNTGTGAVTRTRISSSSNSNAAVNFTGASDVIVCPIGLDMQLPWLPVTGNVTAPVGGRLQCDTTSGPLTVTLPASPVSGDSVCVKGGPAAATNNLTVGRNGNTIMSLSEDMTVSSNNVEFTLVYDGSTWGL